MNNGVRLLARTWFVLVIGLTSVLPGRVGGVEFQWVSPANTQVLIVTDSRVAAALKIAAIDRAQSTIDSVTYFQGVDPDVGMPELQAFRRAQNRGLRGRYIQERIPTLTSDMANIPRKMLADAELKSPGELVSFGGLRNWLAGLRLTDFVHEKVLILDAGTPNETIILSGCNNSDHAIHNIDLTVVIRPLVPGSPSIGDQLKTAYNTLWDVVTKVHPPHIPRKRSQRYIPAPDKDIAVTLETDRQRAEFDAMNAMLSSPVDPMRPPASFESRPERMRVLTNDLLLRAYTQKFSRRLSKRLHLDSDIITAAAPTVATAKRIYASMMTIKMPETLKAAFKQALANGAEVHLFTNSRETHKTHTPMGLGFDFSLADINELMEVGGKLSVYVLDEALLKQRPELYHMVTYLHRKLMIVDDHVFLGSDNYNVMSSATNSELVVETQDRVFADKMMSVMETDLAVFEKLTCQDALLEKSRYGLIKRGLNRVFLPFY